MMTEQMLSPLSDTVCPHPSPGTSPAQTHGIGVRRRHATTINILPDEIFLEIFAFYLCNCKPASWRMWEWRRLVRVCQRWRQIIYGSPRYLDLLLYCSNGVGRSPVKKDLTSWP
ncbi:hypothetical protein EDB89DRAFT_2004022, partial [Lactarius sanguifluus]